jgi:hypothetical protein
MRIKIVAYLSAASLLGVVACSSGQGDGEADEGDQAVRRTSLAKLGEACGSDVAIRKECAAGLTCVLPTSGPISEHTAGTCKHLSQKHGPCGDDVAVQAVCDTGLTCLFPTSGPISEHTAGSCEEVSGKGGPCGDDVAIQKKCAPGLKCVFPTTGFIGEHTPGVCK